MINVLISNDDGISAPGLMVLVEKLQGVAQIFVAAPIDERSSTGHAITLNSTISFEKHGPRSVSTSGYPADCVIFGLHHAFSDIKFDLVISGINNGANLGQDIYYSGTVAAAREGSFCHIPAIALSLVTESSDVTGKATKELNFEVLAMLSVELIKRKIYEYIMPYEVLNINSPNIPWNLIKGIQATNLGVRKYSKDFSLQYLNDHSKGIFTLSGTPQKIEENLTGNGPYDTEIISKEMFSLTILNIFGQQSDSLKKWQAIAQQLQCEILTVE